MNPAAISAVQSTAFRTASLRPEAAPVVASPAVSETEGRPAIKTAPTALDGAADQIDGQHEDRRPDSHQPASTVALGLFVQDTANANAGTKRGRAMVEASLRRYGAGRSILVDKVGRIIAGNTTHEAAVDIGLEGCIAVPTDGLDARRASGAMASPRGGSSGGW